MADRSDTDMYRLTLPDWSTTGPSSSCATLDAHNVSVTTRVLGTAVFFLIWPFVVFNFGAFPISRAIATLAGGMLMVVCGVVSQDDVYLYISDEDNMQTLFLLFGMMIIAYFFQREGFLRAMVDKTMAGDQQFGQIIWKICLLSAAMSALVTNDAACTILTPWILEEHSKQRRSRDELLPLCLAIATSSEIGSCATVFGSPQNVYIAAKADLNLWVTLRCLLPAVLVGLAFNTMILYLTVWRSGLLYCQSSAIEWDWQWLEVISNPSESSALAWEANKPQIHIKQPNRVITHRDGEETSPLLCKYQKMTHNLPSKQLRVPLKRPSAEKIFSVWLVTATLTVIILLTIPTSISHFNIGIIPVGAAISTLVVDGVLCKNNPKVAISTIDWSVILMFLGLFIWQEGFEATGYPTAIFTFLTSHWEVNVHTIQGIFVFTVVVAIGSNVLSNVPLALLFAKKLSCLPGAMAAVSVMSREGCLLIWVTGIAGNFTLIGSMSSLIVAEKAHDWVNYQLSFWNYLKFGFPSAFLVLVAGVPMVTLLS